MNLHRIVLTAAWLTMSLSTFAQAPRYLYMFHNINSFIPQPDQELAVEAYKGIEAVAKRNGVPLEPFFTGLSFEMYLRNAPELMEELKNSDRDWNHHGANRPPRPQLIQRVGRKSWEEAIQVVDEYERSALDIRTGKLDPAKVGGLKMMTDYFGRPPLSTGRFVRAPIMAHAKDRYGALMGIGTHDWFGIPSAWLWYMGALNRPDDAFVHPNWDFMEWVRVEWAKKQGQDPDKVQRSRPDEPWEIFTKIEQRLNQLDPDTPGFLVFGFHNNDLFGYNYKTKKRFEPEYREFFLEKMDEFLKWVIQKKGIKPVSLRQAYEMAKANVILPSASDAKTFAAQIVESVEKEKTLPLYVRSPRSGHSLVEAWQLLVATLTGAEVVIKDLYGPTKMAVKASEPLRATAAEVRAAARALPESKSIPSSVEVAGRQANAAEFLCLMAKVAGGARQAEAPPLPLAPPVAARENRFSDPLSLLQMWTYKPAYFDKPGGRLQFATSVEVNLRSGRMWNENQMRLLRPEDRPPW